MSRIIKDYRVTILIDEIEKLFAGIQGDSTGVTQDQLAVTLQVMNNREYDGIILYGVQGSGKTAVVNAIAKKANIPLIEFDLGAMKGKYVGQSEGSIRMAWDVVEAISQGKALVIGTCNSMANLPLELRRRFTLGTFFFDLPDDAERSAIQKFYMKKYGVKGEWPDVAGWTGAELKQCARLSSRLKVTLKEAAEYIVPICVSAKDQVDNMRKQASGKFTSASQKGIYQKPTQDGVWAGSRNLDV